MAGSLLVPMSSDAVSLLTSVLPQHLLGPRSGLSYDGGNLVVPEGDIAAAINAIIADPNWQANAGKAALKAYAAMVRYNKENGGFKVGGMSYATDLDSQAKLNGAYCLAQINPNVAISWKLPGGTFATLKAADITAAATAVGTFVQQCFSTEATVGIAIDSGAITTTAQIDAQFAAF
jgi:hypothetical protein